MRSLQIAETGKNQYKNKYEEEKLKAHRAIGTLERKERAIDAAMSLMDKQEWKASPSARGCARRSARSSRARDEPAGHRRSRCSGMRLPIGSERTRSGEESKALLDGILLTQRPCAARHETAREERYESVSPPAPKSVQGAQSGPSDYQLMKE